MSEIIIQLAKAKKLIGETKMKKEGKNTFSNYTYFTPSQVEKLVSDACEQSGLITVFQLKRNELGVFGVLNIYSLESTESLSFEMATAIPEIKATNIAQQLGGCVTYTERYLKQSIFGITDNSLDFDTTENTIKQTKDAKEAKETKEKKSIDEKTHNTFIDKLQSEDNLQKRKLNVNWILTNYTPTEAQMYEYNKLLS
jgi:hypothetical protein